MTLFGSRPVRGNAAVSPSYQSRKMKPLGLLSSLVLMLGFMFMGTMSSCSNAEQEMEYLANPQAGDLYRYKMDDGNYSTYRVISSTTDSVFVLENDYWVDEMRGIKEILSDENYSDNQYYMSRADIKAKYDANTIYSVDR